MMQEVVSTLSSSLLHIKRRTKQGSQLIMPQSRQGNFSALKIRLTQFLTLLRRYCSITREIKSIVVSCFMMWGDRFWTLVSLSFWMNLSSTTTLHQLLTLMRTLRKQLFILIQSLVTITLLHLSVELRTTKCIQQLTYHVTPSRDSVLVQEH